MSESCGIGSVDECIDTLRRFREAGADEIVTYGSTPGRMPRWRRRGTPCRFPDSAGQASRNSASLSSWVPSLLRPQRGRLAEVRDEMDRQRGGGRVDLGECDRCGALRAASAKPSSDHTRRAGGSTSRKVPLFG